MLNQFIIETSNGKRTRTNGKRIGKFQITAYQMLKVNLEKFITDTKFKLHLIKVGNLNEREVRELANYWKNFYHTFSDYLYFKRDLHDNYVWGIFRDLKTFLNYLNKDLHLGIGEFHRSFHIPSETIPIIVLTPDQLNKLIYDENLNKNLPKKLKFTKDLFVFGCTVALRYGDLIAIQKENIFHYNGNTYLKVTSSKTSSHTTICLPDYALAIMKKYENKRRKSIFPYISKCYLNEKLKLLARYLDLKDECVKYRCKRGVKYVIYKDKAKKKHYTIADHFSTHTMRRTAITTMLRMDMPEQIVRKISGHTPNSSEFYKYVQFAQNYVDQHTEVYFKKMKQMLQPTEK